MSVGSVSLGTRRSEGSTFLEMRFSHPMENGERRDGRGTSIPSWYLTEVEVLLNDERVSRMELGPLVSRNPAMSLVLATAKVDDTVTVKWKDNRAKSGERTVTIQA